MKHSTRILDLVRMLDNLNTIRFTHDGGSMSKVKKKRFGDKYVVMKKKKESDSYSDDNYLLIKLFFREAINLILAEHPAILPICGWNFFHYSDKNKEFVYRHSNITTFCDGGTLGSFLLTMKAKKQELKRIQTQQYLFAYGIAKAMEHLYIIGIIHRDLKTENIFVSSPKWENENIPKEIEPLFAKRNNEDDGYYIPLLADLGFAKRTDENDENSNTYGTPIYYAPEQIRSNNFSFPADVYSYGITLSDIFQQKKKCRISIKCNKRFK